MEKWIRPFTTADRLKFAMKIRGVKQVDLSKMTGIHKGSLSNYTSGRYEPKSEAINKLAKALNCSEMWLWGYDVPMERFEEQKKSDAQIDIADRLYNDASFYEAVSLLDKLDPEQFKKITELMQLFCKETSDKIE